MLAIITPSKRKEIIQNFISTMDTSLDMGIHLLNAETDADLYRWDDITFEIVIKNIYKVYRDLKRANNVR